MIDYLMRPSVNAEGSPKEADSIVGRTKSTPYNQLLVEGVDFFGLMMGLQHIGAFEISTEKSRNGKHSALYIIFDILEHNCFQKQNKNT